MDDSHRPILGVAAVGTPADYDMLHRSFVRSLRAENAAPRTIEAYTLAVERLGEYLGDLDAELDVTDDLRREHVEGFLNALSDQGLAPATINKRYRSLMRFFGYLVEEGEIETHPMAHIRPPKVPEQPVPVRARPAAAAQRPARHRRDRPRARTAPRTPSERWR